MKTIIALWHSANKGKTQTLIELKKLICAEATKIIYDENYGESSDFCFVAEIFGKTIGIESMGDPDSNVKGRLQNLFDNYKTEYVFCATRTRGDTVGDVLDYKEDNDTKIIWDSTYQTYDEEMFGFVNKQKAKNLFDFLKSLILINSATK